MTHLVPTLTLLHIFIQPWSRELQKTNLLMWTGGSPPQSSGMFCQRKGHSSESQQRPQLKCRATAHLQVGPLDSPDAPGRVPPGLLGSKGQLILCQVVGSCCFYLLGHCFQSAQLFFDFWPFEQEAAVKRNNENFIQSADVLFIFWHQILQLVQCAMTELTGLMKKLTH